MSIYRLDIVVTILILLFGLWVGQQAFSYGVTSSIGPGSGTFPLIAAVLLVFFSALKLVAALCEGRQNFDFLNGRELAKIAIVAVTILTYLFLSRYVDMLILMPVLIVIISVTVLGTCTPLFIIKSCVAAVAYTGVLYAIFALFLKVNFH